MVLMYDRQEQVTDGNFLNYLDTFNLYNNEFVPNCNRCVDSHTYILYTFKEKRTRKLAIHAGYNVVI